MRLRCESQAAAGEHAAEVAGGGNCGQLHRALATRGHATEVVVVPRDDDKTEAKKSAAISVFESVWGGLEATLGRQAMVLPKEIMWLGGACAWRKSARPAPL